MTSENTSIGDIHDVVEDDEIDVIVAGGNYSQESPSKKGNKISHHQQQKKHLTRTISNYSENSDDKVESNGKKMYSERVASKSSSEPKSPPLIPMPIQNKYNQGATPDDFNIDFEREREATKTRLNSSNIMNKIQDPLLNNAHGGSGNNGSGVNGAFIKKSEDDLKEDENTWSEWIMDKLSTNYRMIGTTWQHTTILCFCSFTVLKVIFNLINAFSVAVFSHESKNPLWWLMLCDLIVDVALVYVGFTILGQHVWDSTGTHDHTDLTVPLTAFGSCLIGAWIFSLITVYKCDDRYMDIYWGLAIVELFLVPFLVFTTWQAYRINTEQSYADLEAEKKPLFNKKSSHYGSSSKRNSRGSSEKRSSRRSSGKARNDMMRNSEQKHLASMRM